MEYQEIEKLRNEIKKKIKMVFEVEYDSKFTRFRSTKFLLLETLIAMVFLSLFFKPAFFNLPQAFSFLLMQSIFAITFIVFPINIVLGILHNLQVKKALKRGKLTDDLLLLIDIEKRIFEKNINSSVEIEKLPTKKEIILLSSSFPQYVVFGPRGETYTMGKDKEIRIYCTQDFLGYQGKLLVIEKELEFDIKHEIKLIYDEHEWILFINNEEMSLAELNETNTLKLLKQYAEIFSLDGHVYIIMTKRRARRYFFIIISEYLPLEFEGYSLLPGFINFSLELIKVIHDAF